MYEFYLYLNMKVFILLFSLYLPNILFSQTLKINVTGLRNNLGTVWIGFYTSDESFDKEQPLFFKRELKEKTKDGFLTITYNGIKPGVYGIAFMDDENNNGQMDYGLFLPKEGFGFSNYYHTGLTKPKLKKFSFVVKEGVATVVEIKVRYL